MGSTGLASLQKQLEKSQDEVRKEREEREERLESLRMRVNQLNSQLAKKNKEYAELRSGLDHEIALVKQSTEERVSCAAHSSCRRSPHKGRAIGLWTWREWGTCAWLSHLLSLFHHPPLGQPRGGPQPGERLITQTTGKGGGKSDSICFDFQGPVAGLAGLTCLQT